MFQKPTITVALSSKDKLDRRRIFNWIEDKFPNYAKDIEAVENNGKLTFTYKNMSLTFLELGLPFLHQDELRALCHETDWWEDAYDILRDHKAHIAISLYITDGENRDIYDESTILTIFAAAIAATHEDSLGVYWGYARKLMSPTRFQKRAMSLLRDEYPILCWIRMEKLRDETLQTGLFTTGLSLFGGKEIEFEPTKRPQKRLVKAAELVINYVFKNKRSLRGGEMLQFSPNVYVRAENRPSLIDRPVSVQVIDFVLRRADLGDDDDAMDNIEDDYQAPQQPQGHDYASGNDDGSTNSLWGDSSSDSGDSNDNSNSDDDNLETSDTQSNEDIAEIEEDNFWSATDKAEAKPFITDSPAPKDKKEVEIDDMVPEDKGTSFSLVSEKADMFADIEDEPKPEERIRSTLERIHFDDISDQVMPRIKESILLIEGEPSSNEIITSHFDGMPVLPNDIDWPSYKLPTSRGSQKGGKEYGLNFLAQISLHEMPMVENRDLLPQEGELYFFADIYSDLSFNDIASWRVIFYEGDASQFWPSMLPGNLLKPDFKFLPKIKGRDGKLLWTQPAQKRSIAAFRNCSVKGNSPFYPGKDPLADIVEAKQERFMEKLIIDSIEQKELEKGEKDFTKSNPKDKTEFAKHILGKAHHQFLGHAAPLGFLIHEECESFVLRHENKDFYGSTKGTPEEEWMLLLQLSSDGEDDMAEEKPTNAAPWHFEETGKLFFCIRRADLIDQRFDRCVLLARGAGGQTMRLPVK